MKNVVVVGSQWGDEGKGKIVDWLSSEADVVVRFQGGHNAGHTLVIDKKVVIALDKVHPVPWVFLVLIFLFLKTLISLVLTKMSSIYFDFL